MTYNGWTNYATWNVNLWIENTEWMYREKQARLRLARAPITGADVARFCAEVLGGATTPDLRSCDPAMTGPVNFTEIAEHWEAERLELVA